MICFILKSFDTEKLVDNNYGCTACVCCTRTIPPQIIQNFNNINVQNDRLLNVDPYHKHHF